MNGRRYETAIAVAATLLVAGTRLLALARTPWDWDEMLFLLGLADYDVSLHHPHPPGFPLFMLAARAFVAAGADPFRALQLVNVVTAVAIVPAFLFLCRELRLPFPIALSASLLFSFFPNVWFFGGTGFSDVAAIVLTIVACALLLRGARSPAALLFGAVVLAVAAGFRPQNLLVGAVPATLAAWSQWRSRRHGAVIAAAVVGFAIVAGSYAGAVHATGDWARYRDALLAHQRYLAEIDSFLSDARPSLLQISDDFFVRPFRFPVANVTLLLFAVISLVRSVVERTSGVLLALAMFGPFWLLAWFTLDFHSAGRFSIGYMPLLAILAADGFAAAAARFTRRDMLRAAMSITAGTLLAAVMAGWAWSGIRIARSEASPPLQAIAFIRSTSHVETAIYVPKRLRPYAEYYLSDYRLVHLEDESPAALANVRGGIMLREGGSTAQGAQTFSWPRDPLWNIVRRRYFDVSTIPR